VAIIASLQRADFMTGLDQRMRDAATTFKIEMLSAVEMILRAMASDSALGDRFGIMAAAAGQSRIQAMMDQEDDAAARGGAVPPDPLAILREEFGKVASMFGIGDTDRAEMAGLIDRVSRRRAENVAAQTTAAPLIVEPTKTAAPEKAPFDPRAVIGGGIANALSLIGGGGSTVILQKQVDLATQTNRKLDATNQRLDEIARNTRAPASRGPIAPRPRFT